MGSVPSCIRFREISWETSMPIEERFCFVCSPVLFLRSAVETVLSERLCWPCLFFLQYNTGQVLACRGMHSFESSLAWNHFAETPLRSPRPPQAARLQASLGKWASISNLETQGYWMYIGWGYIYVYILIHICSIYIYICSFYNILVSSGCSVGSPTPQEPLQAASPP